MRPPPTPSISVMLYNKILYPPSPIKYYVKVDWFFVMQCFLERCYLQEKTRSEFFMRNIFKWLVLSKCCFFISSNKIFCLQHLCNLAGIFTRRSHLKPWCITGTEQTSKWPEWTLYSRVTSHNSLLNYQSNLLVRDARKYYW